MKPIFALIPLGAALVLGGCVVSQQVYIDNAAVNGPMNQPPIHLSRDSTQDLARVSPRFSVNHDKLYTGPIRPESTVDQAKPHKLQWNLPEYSLGAGVDVGISRIVSLFIGADYAAVQSNGFWYGYAGIGLHSASDILGFRVDGGFCLRSMSHDVNSVVVTTTTGIFGTNVDTGYFHDRGDDVGLDIFASITLNTRQTQWPVNVFVNAGITRQTLLNYSPATWSEFHPFVTFNSSGADAIYRATFLSFTPGVAINVGTEFTLLVGGRYLRAMDMDGLAPESSFSPFVQLDVEF